MRRQEQEIEDQAEIANILSSSLICRIGLFGDEYPYVVPMNYGYQEGSLYFHCAAKGKKIDLIKQNNKACFEIEKSHEIIAADVSCKWATKYKSLIGYGEIEIINNFEKKKIALDIIMKQHGKDDNYYKDSAVENVTILKLTISSLTGKQSN